MTTSIISWARLHWRDLRTCRISILSVAAGAALLTLGQARDFFLDGQPGWWRWLCIWGAVGLFWAVPVHYGARYALTRTAPTGQHARAASSAVPRVLGWATFVLMAAASGWAWCEIRGATSIAEVQQASDKVWSFAVSGFAVGAFFYGYVNYRKTLFELLLRRASPRSAKALAKLPYAYVAVAVAAFVAMVAVAPLSGMNSRLLFVPLMLGAWVPALTLLAVAGDRFRLPLSTALLALGGIFWAVGSDRFLDVPTLDANSLKGAPSGLRQTTLLEAIDQWKAANDCVRSACPPPILVAAEGGASRAAFAVSTVLGVLMDIGDEKAFADQVFALSGVSGGALGVATFRAALTDSAGGLPPCQKTVAGWYRNDKTGADESWRNCLQALVVGDYLTPAFIGLAFRDWAEPLSSLVPFDNRSILLQRAVERHYTMATRGQADDCDAIVAATGLCRPFGYRGTASWTPLLFLNATSVDTGKPIVVSDVRLNGVGGDQAHDFMPRHADAFELLAGGKGTCPDGKRPGGTDLAMGAAVVLSARFPVVSSEGSLRGRDCKVAARAVDGGYFDNSGLVSLNAVAAALADRDLHPVILHITNDPASSAAGGTEVLPFVDRVGSPLLTLVRSREGHVAEARAEADRITKQKIFDIRLSMEFKLRNDAKRLSCQDIKPETIKLSDISMSWWLSGPVQSIIDIQLCSEKNTEAIEGFLQAAKGGRWEKSWRR